MTINKGGENRPPSATNMQMRPRLVVRPGINGGKVVMGESPAEPIEDLENRMIAAQQATDAALGTIYGLHCKGTLSSGRLCRKLLALIVSAPWLIECPRCGYRNSN